METIYKETTSEYVKSINPLVLTIIDEEAMQFADAATVAQDLEQAEGVAFKVGRPGDRQPK